ncbi:hypothetical protein [Tropicibacter oceani]|uniref:Cthe-2314-like HEPN domain-containing protein n=1 Tax=Tropicibacter oceani TaxID=3058420 RepID=A0ABY8QLS5_9RHOB|nr:hypothetical protein [Tropicibacter oceani]WGW05585.1 hypothetical protein QF118_08565 [Tropicibacter oceani]
MALAEYMSHLGTEDTEGFSQAVSTLSDEAWKFALQFSPYQKIETILDNLEGLFDALREEFINLSSYHSGMSAALDIQADSNTSYEREYKKTASSLITFSALYATYVDLCFRIRDLCKLKNSKPYSRAIQKAIKDFSEPMGFMKDLRNFLLHYSIPKFSHSVQLDGAKREYLLINSADIACSGFKWKADTRNYLYRNKKIDVISLCEKVVKGVRRSIDFHRKVSERVLKKEKNAHDFYKYQRKRHEFFSQSVTDFGALIKRPTPLHRRLLEAEFVANVLNSSLTDEEASDLLKNYPNRFKILPQPVLAELNLELENLIKSRKLIPDSGMYFSGK